MLRAVLLSSAALAFGAAIGLVDPDTRTGFWLAMLAGFLGAWGCCPLSQPLLERHKALAEGTSPHSADPEQAPTPTSPPERMRPGIRVFPALRRLARRR